MKQLTSSQVRSMFLEYFKENGIRVVFLDIPTTQMDFSTIEDSMAQMILKCINDMLISFYDCIVRTELERKKKRQKEGYEELRKRGNGTSWADHVKCQEKTLQKNMIM